MHFYEQFNAQGQAGQIAVEDQDDNEKNNEMLDDLLKVSGFESVDS